MCKRQMSTTFVGDHTVCMVDITVGEPCIDFNECSINDQWAADSLTKRTSGAACRGSLAPSQACNDNNACTDEDIFVEVPRDFTTSQIESKFICCEAIAAGRPCDDDVVCAEDDVCMLGWSDDNEIGVCLGTPFADDTCNDDDQCTGPDTCVLTEDGTFAFFQGAPGINLPCDDGDICTDNDICLSTSNGPGPAAGCRGPPASGILCDDDNTCTTNDACTASPRRMT
jgi:hypothetical protein